MGSCEGCEYWDEWTGECWNDDSPFYTEHVDEGCGFYEVNNG